MPQQEDNPKYWHRMLQDWGVTPVVARHTQKLFRAVRAAHDRVWRFTYAGAVFGAVVGVLVAVPVVRLSLDGQLSWFRLALLATAAALVGALAWRIGHWLMQRAHLLPGRYQVQDFESYVEHVVDAVAAGLARSSWRPRDEMAEIEQLSNATIVTGLRNAPVGDLERNLLERLVGSAFVPTAEGGIYVLTLGEPCIRCSARTRTGALRMLDLPGYWAAEIGYLRLKELPSRGRHLRVVLKRAQDLNDFLGPPVDNNRPLFFGPKSEVLLCDACADIAVRLGVLQDHQRSIGEVG